MVDVKVDNKLYTIVLRPRGTLGFSPRKISLKSICDVFAYVSEFPGIGFSSSSITLGGKSWRYPSIDDVKNLENIVEGNYLLSSSSTRFNLRSSDISLNFSVGYETPITDNKYLNYLITAEVVFGAVCVFSFSNVLSYMVTGAAIYDGLRRANNSESEYINVEVAANNPIKKSDVSRRSEVIGLVDHIIRIPRHYSAKYNNIS